MKKSRGNKGQFSIIAAILVSIILVAAVIMTYSMIRHNPSRESPKVLTSIGEINLAVKRILEFTVAYYGSILQVTGNMTYAKDRVASYFESGLVNIAHSHPEWNPSFDVDFQSVSTLWFMPESYSLGNISVTYSLSGLGVQGVNYTTSSLLKATILEPMNGNQTRILVTREDDEPELRLRTENFFFYNYSYSDSTWKLVHPDSDPLTFSNGTYVLQIPSGVDKDAYSIQVVDPRGIMVTAFYSEGSLISGIPQYTYTFTWNTSLYSSLTRDTIVVEALQNGTLRWLDHTLLHGRPIPPIPVKAFRISVNANAQNLDEKQVPFQVEDWGSNYRVPLGLTSNASVLGGRNMFVFLVNHGVQNVTFWWDGRDVASQTSYAWENKYFTVDTVQRTLTNTILTLKIDFSDGTFKVISTVGTTQSTAEFMRINDDVADYGSAEPTYAIPDGTVRAIVQHEVEWGGGAPNCPNVYAQIVLTLPANATYYTYASRFIFVNSSQSRNIWDLSPIQLSSGWMSGTFQSLTENGTSSGYPIVAETYMDDTDLFYNFSSPSTGWAHHWSEYISGNNGGGIMFTDSSNLKLYTFDSSKYAGDKTGALSITTAQRTGWTTPTAVYDKCGESGSYVASRAIDGSTWWWSYWRHSSTCNHWITLDMGRTTDISRIRIYQSGTSSERWGQSNGIEVYVSDDPDNWGSAVWTGTLNSGGWQYSGIFSAQGRYVRLYSLSTSSSQRLYEVEVQTQEGRATIELNPVTQDAPVSPFKDALDVTWHGAVVTFEDEPIYPSSGGNIGLWVIVEHPPTVTVS